MKMMAGAFSRASANRLLTSFSDSPSHLGAGQVVGCQSRRGRPQVSGHSAQELVNKPGWACIANAGGAAQMPAPGSHVQWQADLSLGDQV